MNIPFAPIVLVCALLAAAVMHISRGMKDVRHKASEGQQVTWYKQQNTLLGIVYILLSIVVVLDARFRATGILPSTMLLFIEWIIALVGLLFTFLTFMYIRARRK